MSDQHDTQSLLTRYNELLARKSPLAAEIDRFLQEQRDVKSGGIGNMPRFIAAMSGLERRGAALHRDRHGLMSDIASLQHAVGDASRQASGPASADTLRELEDLSRNLLTLRREVEAFHET
jgi:hypothetical protein